LGGRRLTRTLALPPVIEDGEAARLISALFEAEAAGAPLLAREAQLLALQRAWSKRANGAVTTASYDNLRQLSTLGTESRGKAVQSLGYRYDQVGNLRACAYSGHADRPFRPMPITRSGQGDHPGRSATG
jgi:hypothetical protein